MTMSASTVDFHYSINNNAPWDEWCYNNSGAFLPFPASWPSDGSPVEDLSQMAMPTKSAIPYPKFVNPESLQSFSASSTSPISNGDSEEYEPSPNHSSKKRKIQDKHSIKQALQIEHSPPHGFSRKVVPEPVRRERNRTAAAKCRAKSKAAEEELKEVQRIERDRNRALRATFDQLTNEALMLKHELLCHSDCNHPVIDKYLMRAANRISNGHRRHTKSSPSTATSETED